MSSSVDYQKEYEEYLILKNYSQGTLELYMRALVSFFEYCRSNRDDTKGYQNYARGYILEFRSKGLSWSTLNIHYSSLKLFCTKIRREQWDIDHLPRPKGSKTLPRILSEQEVVRLIEAPSNFKHRFVIAFMYATGLRISEVLNLKINDVDGDRLELFIRQGKGGKDRLVRIPQKLLVLLRIYYKQFKPKEYLFEGSIKGTAYAYASIRKILLNAKRKAKIGKRVSPHTMRHCYATHHLENGTDLVYLKEQLGHSKLMTTAKYIHLCQKQQRHINHPFEKFTMNILRRIT